MKVKEIIKKVIGVFFEIKEPEVKTREKIPFENNPNVDYKGYFCWENEMTLDELLFHSSFDAKQCMNHPLDLMHVEVLDMLFRSPLLYSK